MGKRATTDDADHRLSNFNLPTRAMHGTASLRRVKREPNAPVPIIRSQDN